NLPTVAIHEVAVHPTAGEIVVATHGRSLWVLDVGGLRQMNAKTVKADAHLYQPHTVIRYRSEPSRGGTTRRYTGESAPFGANIYYNLNKPATEISVKIVDATGETVSELARVSKEVGLHKLSWALNRTGANPLGGLLGGLGGGQGGGGGRRGQAGAGGGEAATGTGAATGGGTATAGQGQGQGRRQGGGTGGGAGTGGGGGRRAQGGTGGAAAGTASGGTATQAGGGGATQAQGTGGGPVGMGGGGGPGGFGGFGRVVPPGTYGVILTVDGKEYKQIITVQGDPTLPDSIRLTDEEEEEWEQDQKTYRRMFEKKN
ncbi:MAG TPA: hypothetical protein PLX97_01610, partial [Gemmatales bacterium]|nr:hypothetical protein [Gemmatales bacterium]